MTLKDAAKMFGLRMGEPFSFLDLRFRYHEMSMSAHPDHGGTQEGFDALSQAYSRLRPYTGERCGVCDGRVSYVVEKGLSKLTVRCPWCAAKGAADDISE